MVERDRDDVLEPRKAAVVDHGTLYVGFRGVSCFVPVPLPVFGDEDGPRDPRLDWLDEHREFWDGLPRIKVGNGAVVAGRGEGEYVPIPQFHVKPSGGSVPPANAERDYRPSTTPVSGHVAKTVETDAAALDNTIEAVGRRTQEALEGAAMLHERLFGPQPKAEGNAPPQPESPGVLPRSIYALRHVIDRLERTNAILGEITNRLS